MSKKKKQVIEIQEEQPMRNYYKLDEVQPFIQEYVNPCYNEETMPLKHCFRAIICGASGSGKSNVLLNIIEKMSGTFNYIKIFTQDKNEPLYEFLANKIDKEFLEIHEGIKALNEMDFSKLEGQQLFIFDDMVIERNQKMIEELYIRGRKMSDKQGISLLYLTQSYYDVPKVIRKQCNELILKKINGNRELASIIRDCSALELEKNQLQNMYNFCVADISDICNFMLIQKSAPYGKNYRKNLNQILNPNDFI